MRWLPGLRIVCAIALGAAPGVAAAQTGRGAAHSVYSPLNLDRCQRTGGNREEESAIWRCPGYRDIPLFVLAGDGRYDLDAGEDNGFWESQPGPNDPPARIEWRLRGTRPRAIIYRLRLLNAEGGPDRSVLGVETIARPGHWAGCLVAWIDGALPDANALARNRADADHTNFRCGHDAPEEVSR